jgi:hypothetical protein
MSNLSGWDVAILVVAAYISVISLVRLMRARRDEVVANYQIQIAEEQQRQKVERLRQKRKQARARQLRAFRPPSESDEAAA